MKVPVNEPVISEAAKRNVNEALNTGWLSSAGPFVKTFEQEFSRYIGKRHGVACTSGTAALHLALLSLGIGSGDEVIVPAFTMAAVWMAVMLVGAKPVFVDCEPDTFNLNPALIEKKITKKTRAIIVVHLYGHPADMDPIMAVAKNHKLYVVEDAAEAHGAEYKGRLCGSMGDIACFSFFANKLITTGEGGMVLTDDERLAERIRSLGNLCHSKAKRFTHDGIGLNYRMTNLQAAVGVGELSNVNDYVARKRWMAEQYGKRLKNVPGLTLPKEKDYAKSVYWMYAVTVDEKKFGMTKDTLREKLAATGVETRDFFYPPEEQPALRNVVGKKTYPVSARAAKTGFYLPSGLAVTEAQIAYVSEQVAGLSKK